MYEKQTCNLMHYNFKNYNALLLGPAEQIQIQHQNRTFF